MRLFLSTVWVRYASASVLSAALCVPIPTAGAATNRCFDMGDINSILKPRCIRVTKDNVYDRQKGYGWVTAPERETTVKDDPTADELNRDGVASERPIDFRADIPSGPYFVEVTVGKSDRTDADLRVYADGVLAAKSGRFVDSSGGRPRRTLRFPVEVSGGSVTIGVVCNEGVEVNGIAFKVPAYEPFRVEEGKLVSDTPVGFPVYTRGKKLFDVGQYDMAMKQFAYIPDVALQAYCQLAIGGRLDARNAKSLVRDAARAFARYAGSEEAQMVNRFELVQKYLLGVYYYDLGASSYAEQQTGLPVRQRFTVAADLMEQIAADPRDLLYDQALWHLGRIWYWMWREQHGGYQRRESDTVLRTLASKYPEFDLLSMYRGRKIAHHTAYSADAKGAPTWAAVQREALCRLLEVIDYWVENQSQDGEFGSGFEKDSEMLNWWPVAVLAADDSDTREAIRKLAEGVWNSGIIENGYYAAIQDVRRGARLTSSTLPIMVATDYGNPLYIERCMETMKCMRDVWTAVNQRGHLHFRSAWFSATRCDRRPPHAVDVPMNARAAEPGRWLCWYNHNPTVTELFADWGTSWVEDARRTDKGKPEGVVPAAVSFAQDQIGGYSNNWYHPGFQSDYYNWESGGANPIYDHLLATYDLTGDARLLYPIEQGLEMAQGFWRNPVQDTKKGTTGWAANLLDESEFARFGCKLRLLGRFTQFDDYLKARGTPYTRFLLTRDKTFLVEACRDSINSTKYNFPLLTNEVKFADTVNVRGADDLLSMYTGGCGSGAEYPYYAVTWSNTTRNFAALVTNATRKLLKILAYSFEASDRNVVLRPWRLEPGTYRLRIGPDMDGDGEHDLEATERVVQVGERGTPVQVALAARKQLLIQMDQIEKREPPQQYVPDLALTDSDVAVDPLGPRAGSPVTVRIAVHNIGSARAENVNVVLEEGGKRLAEDVIENLDAPNDLEPRIAELAITWTPNLTRTYHLKATIDPDNAIQEISELNNTVEFDLRVAQ